MGGDFTINGDIYNPSASFTSLSFGFIPVGIVDVTIVGCKVKALDKIP